MRSLLDSYAAVVLGYGSDGSRELLDESGRYSRLKGVHSAREFVNWYNGHPDFVSYGQIFQLSKVKNVAIVGHGNVALDCARILLKSLGELSSTDIADHALAELSRSAVQSVTLIGRRGPVQSAFTIKEFRELTKLGGGVRVVTDEQAFQEGTQDADSLATYSQQRPVKRMVDLIRTTVGAIDSVENGGVRSVQLRYLLTPLAYLSSSSPLASGSRLGPIDPSESIVAGRSVAQSVADDMGTMLSQDGMLSTVGAIVCAKNKFAARERVQVAEKEVILGGKSLSSLERCSAVEVLPCDLILTSVGYKSVELRDEATEFAVPFDNEKHIVPNDAGRVVLDPASKGRMYAVGWVGRGPTGIVGTNIPDAKRTAESIILDLSICGQQSDDQDPKVLIKSCADQRNKEVVSWADFLRLDAEEVRRGQMSNPPRPRVKIVCYEEMVRVAKGVNTNKE